tara:strand:+ start:8249 stop:8974 length:726 start_codon:yes stop_codon:yes gene_type:complete
MVKKQSINQFKKTIMRKVTIYSNKTRATQEINTDVATWGELKALISEDMMVSNARCMVKENRMTLESAQAVLPTGDFIVYVYPTKVKSGLTEDAYAELTDAKLRKACQKKSISTTGDSSSMRRRVRAYDKRHGIDSSDETAPKTNKNNVRPTTIRIENAPINILEEDYNEASLLLDACPESLVVNSEVNIRSVVQVMRNKFLNMFDSLLDDIDTGAISRDVDVLAKDAENLAKELGMVLED